MMSTQPYPDKTEAERATFEAWALKSGWKAEIIAKRDGDGYAEPYLTDYWGCWKDARRSMPAAVAEELPPILFDGHAVYSEITRHLGKSHCFAPEAVSATLDAVVRLLRASVPAAGAVQRPVAQAHGHREDFYLLANARRIGLMPIRQVANVSNWHLAHELFAAGSNSAHQICVDAGIDPYDYTVERRAAPAPGNTAQPADDGREWIVFGGRRMGRTYLAKLEQDAARYRWLRDKSEPGICAFYLSVGQAFKDVKFARETVDDAIDAQIATMQSAKGAKESAEGSGS